MAKNKAPINFIGLTGGIATGKSTVSKIFQKLGAVIIDADKISRDLIIPGSPHYKKLIRAFGKEILVSQKKLAPIDRKKLRELIFKDKRALRKINLILEQSIVKTAIKIYRSFNTMQPNKLYLYDAATIFEAKVHKKLAAIITVHVPLKIQIKRLIARDRVTQKAALAIIGAQLPLADKMRKSQYLVNTNKDFKLLTKDIKKLYLRLCQKIK